MAKTVYDVRVENLRALIQQEGGAAEAAKRLEMEPSQLSQMAGRNPTRNVGDQGARRIERAFGLAEGWLDFEHNRATFLQQPVAKFSVRHEPLRLERVPLLGWSEAARWRDVIDQLPPDDPRERIATPARVGPHAYALRIVGDAMTNPAGGPSFPEGTIIIVDPDRSAEPGKFVIVRDKNSAECTFKQLVRDSGKMYLRPLNPRYPILEMAPDAEICGVLVQAVTDF